MPIISSDRTTIYCRDGTTASLPADQARYRTQMQPQEWSMTPPPPLGWERTVPRYKVTRDLQPAQKARFRFEPPFAETWQSDVWQYGEHQLKANDEITTTAWPHPSMRPAGSACEAYAAERVMSYFIGAMKSTLPVSPFLNGRVRLDNGLSNVPILSEVKSPKPAPFNSRPAA
jgi:hypothetical protein